MMETASVKSADPGIVKIVQLTDLHIFNDPKGSLLGVVTADSFQAVLNEVSALRGEKEPDLLLVTGDISQDYSEGSYRRFASMIRQVGKPMFWLPGNHDDGPLMYRIFPGLGLSIARQIFCNNWQIVMLNAQVYSNPCGYLPPDQFEFLTQCLDSHRDMNALICIHHNTFRVNSAWLDQHYLKNADEFTGMLHHYPNVRCVLCGHVHQETDEVHDHIRYISSPATSIQFLPDSDSFGLDTAEPGWRELILHRDGSFETAVHRLHSGLYVPDYASSGY